MIRICFIADATSPHTQKWVRGCLKLHCEIFVISHTPGEIPGAQVIVHPLTLLGFPKYCWSVRRLIRGIRPNIVHAHQFGAHGLYAWFSGCGVLANSAWGSDILVNPRRSFWLRCLVRFLIKRSDIITSVSSQITSELIQLGAKPEKILTFMMGVERADFEWLSQAAKPENPFVICSPRLHEPIYNLPIILKAFQMISHDYPDVWLWVIGSGSLTQELRDFAIHNGSERIKFWGRVSPEQSRELLAQSQIMVSIPKSDGTPVSMMEGMAAGCLLIVSDIPAYREWVRHEENGLVVGFNADELASAFRRGIEQAEFRERARIQNRCLIESRAIWEDKFKMMLDWYKKAAEIE
ncbi:glycosyltransferase involved in cell wall biosynthesis [Hydrogenispora ethanolica]|uniref:Glycosyltransferase involved in cell wall biosynthesis n=1 Tax=Hydrogenispora ethanolica TaxID=1082276 RepID=A0A4R1R8D4_HYDET|nr:glycosyltransferase family 4 protein [Hydrogenispora ethanolica]TCL61809.1 glycosyltransferase involved in cell wall biosynthesis [Hydrogenispora ethanolica]